MAKYTIFKAQESSLEKELEETVEFFRTKNVSINFRDERELNAMRIAEKNSKKDDTEKGSTSSSVKGKGKENKAPNDNSLSRATLAQRARRERERNTGCSAQPTDFPSVTPSGRRCEESVLQELHPTEPNSNSLSTLSLSQRYRQEREWNEGCSTRQLAQPIDFPSLTPSRRRRRREMTQSESVFQELPPNTPKRANVANSFLPSSLCTSLPQTPNQIYNSVHGRTPLRVNDSVENGHLPQSQGDLHSMLSPQNVGEEFVPVELSDATTPTENSSSSHSMLPPRNLSEEFVAVELTESITTPAEEASSSQNIQ